MKLKNKLICLMAFGLWLQLIFIDLKLADFVNWSWVTIFYPLIILVGFFIGLAVAMRDEIFEFLKKMKDDWI